jgi:hypothetical protein
MANRPLPLGRFLLYLVMAGVLFGTTSECRAQLIMDNLTDTTQYSEGLFAIYKDMNRLRFSGYIQPQYQVAQSPGAPSFNGGDFPEEVNNRFMLRRGRLRVDYSHVNEEGLPTIYFAYQFDGTERGVFTRDFFGRVYENKWSVFNLSAGIFPRPFGYEINLSSSDRESPERGRMSQILMRTERDVGAMLSFQPQRDGHPLSFLRIDLGVFNGQGLTSPNDFDSHKDLVSRISVKKLKPAPNLSLSAGVSVLYGGMEQFTQEIYRMQTEGFRVDRSPSNLGRIAPRHYYGADVQLGIKNPLGQTTLRAEGITGTQTSTQTTSETPGSIPGTLLMPAPLYIRPFHGAYLYFLHSLPNPQHQFGMKYDWYDPNSLVAGQDIDEGYTPADVRFATLGMGYNYYINANLRLLLWYEFVRNENTRLEGYQQDLEDNIFTCRLQFRF